MKFLLSKLNFLFFILSIPILAWRYFLHKTCRIEIKNGDYLNFQRPFIFCFWHYNAVPVAVVVDRKKKRLALLMNGIWYWTYIQLIMRYLGVERLVHGRSGGSDRSAIEELADCAKEGLSICITPDGPRGPPRQLRSGVMVLAKSSGVPLMPVDFELSSYATIPFSWDGKRVPNPFSKVTLYFGEPIYVTPENEEFARAKLQHFLDYRENLSEEDYYLKKTS